MKKILLLFALSTFTFFSKAQSVSVTAFGNPVSQGEVIVVEATVEDADDFKILTWNPELYASASAAETFATVTVSTDDADFTICWPNQCVGVQAGVPKVREGELGTTHVDLEIHRMIMTFGTEPVKIPEGVATISVQASGEQPLTFTVKCLAYEEEADENGVAEIAPDTEIISVYDLSGRRLSSRQKGVNIVVYSNGKTVKEIIN